MLPQPLNILLRDPPGPSHFIGGYSLGPQAPVDRLWVPPSASWWGIWPRIVEPIAAHTMKAMHGREIYCHMASHFVDLAARGKFKVRILVLE